MSAIIRCSLAMFRNDAFGQLDRNVAGGRPLFEASSHWMGFLAKGVRVYILK